MIWTFTLYANQENRMEYIRNRCATFRISYWTILGTLLLISVLSMSLEFRTIKQEEDDCASRCLEIEFSNKHQTDDLQTQVKDYDQVSMDNNQYEEEQTDQMEVPRETSDQVEMEISEESPSKTEDRRESTRQVTVQRESVHQSCKRKDRLREACKRNGWDSSDSHTERPDYYQHLLTDDQHKVLYCYIPKVGCTSFKTLMAKAARKFNYTERDTVPVYTRPALRKHDLRYLDEYNMTAIRYRLDNYKKFMVVRHPFDRLESAYTEKILHRTMMSKTVINTINKYFPPENPSGDKDVSHITFSQFLQLIVGGYSTEFLNMHWLSFYDWCHPCHIKYDFVAKLESLEMDIEVILRWLDYTKAGLEHQNESRNKDTSEKFQQVSKVFHRIKPTVITKLMEIYGKDFELFGYTWDHDSGASCTNTVTARNVTVCC